MSASGFEKMSGGSAVASHLCKIVLQARTGGATGRIHAKIIENCSGAGREAARGAVVNPMYWHKF